MRGGGDGDLITGWVKKVRGTDPEALEDVLGLGDGGDAVARGLLGR